VSERSGCALTELTTLEVLDTATQGGPPAHVRSSKVLEAIEERTGLGPRYAYEMLLDLTRPWVLPIVTVAVQGNGGSRSYAPAAGPEFTQTRPSQAGALVLEAEAHRMAPVPVGLINGTTYRGGTRPALDPFAVLAALRRLLEDPGTPTTS
jgi:hypothetical protein